MKKTVISLLVTTLFATCAMAQNIATVNGKPISVSRERVLTEQIQRLQPGAPIDANQIKDSLITQEVLSQEAIKQGLNQSEVFKEQLELTQRSLLVAALYEQYTAKNPVNDKAVTAEYERMKSLMTTEYMARHILVPTEAEAKEIIAQINQGAKFAELAASRSQDPGSAKDGGLLDWAPASTYVPEFADALKVLQPGKVTQAPIQTQYGWHVIKLEEVRDGNKSAFPPLTDDIKSQIRNQLEQKNFLLYQEKLIQQADIKKVE